MKRVTLGPAYAVRLRDLSRWHRIAVTCFRCRAQGLLEPQRLLQRWPDDSFITDLERRFRCRHCGNRLENTWQILQLERND